MGHGRCIGPSKSMGEWFGGHAGPTTYSIRLMGVIAMRRDRLIKLLRELEQVGADGRNGPLYMTRRVGED